MKPIHFREQDFKREVEKQPYSKQVRDEFFDYWSEPDRAASPKMRFEKEKTWDLGRRLARWARNSKTAVQNSVVKKELTDFDRIDSLLAEYSKTPSMIKKETLAAWYDFMIENKLMKQFTKAEVKEIVYMFGNDNLKCRAYCVAETFKGYVNSLLTISDIIRMREKLNV